MRSTPFRSSFGPASARSSSLGIFSNLPVCGPSTDSDGVVGTSLHGSRSWRPSTRFAYTVLRGRSPVTVFVRRSPLSDSNVTSTRAFSVLNIRCQGCGAFGTRDQLILSSVRALHEGILVVLRRLVTMQSGLGRRGLHHDASRAVHPKYACHRLDESVR